MIASRPPHGSRSADRNKARAHREGIDGISLRLYGLNSQFCLLLACIRTIDASIPSYKNGIWRRQSLSSPAGRRAFPVAPGDPDPSRDPGPWPFAASRSMQDGARRWRSRLRPCPSRSWSGVRQGHSAERFVPRRSGKTVEENPFRPAPMGPAAGWKVFGCLSSCPAGPIRSRRLAACRSGVRCYGETKVARHRTGQEKRAGA